MRRVWHMADEKEIIQKLGKQLTEVIERFGVRVFLTLALLV
jgi:hypothetical protein